MRNRININEHDITDNQSVMSLSVVRDSSYGSVEQSPINEILVAEGCENFKNYVEILGLTPDQDFVVLSSIHHFFYDAEEMKKIKGIINLKELNKIKNIKNFLLSIFHAIPSKGYLLGCFVDNKKQNGFSLRRNSSDYTSQRNEKAIENGILSTIPILNMLYNFMDSKTNNYMSKISVTMMLEEHGFKVMNMTEQNRVTYFCARRVSDSTPPTGGSE